MRSKAPTVVFGQADGPIGGFPEFPREGDFEYFGCAEKKILVNMVGGLIWTNVQDQCGNVAKSSTRQRLVSNARLA